MKLSYAVGLVAFILVGCIHVSVSQQVNNSPLAEVPVLNEASLPVQNYTAPDVVSVEEVVSHPTFNYSEVIVNATTNQTYTIYSNFPIVNETEELEKFKQWALQHGIEIIGVNKSTDYFYYNGSKPTDFLPVEGVPNALQVANALYKIPDNLLIVMSGKAFYLSYLSGRGYTVLGSFSGQGILTGLKRGSIIEQPLSEEQVIHEFSHILDYHGIRGVYNDDKNNWKYLEAGRAEIFAVPFPYDPELLSPPSGYVDVYSTANDAENFAQHFMYYVLRGAQFREKALRDAELEEKYLFFKQELFNGKEYN